MGNSYFVQVPDIKNKKDFAELMRNVHYAVVCSDNRTISAQGEMVYDSTKATFLVAIGLAYPEVDIERIYDIWCDCNESVAYCVEWYKRDLLDKALGKVERAYDDIPDYRDIPRKTDNAVKWRRPDNSVVIGSFVSIPGMTVKYGYEWTNFAILTYQANANEHTMVEMMDILPIKDNGEDANIPTERIKLSDWEISDFEPILDK